MKLFTLLIYRGTKRTGRVDYRWQEPVRGRVIKAYVLEVVEGVTI